MNRRKSPASSPDPGSPRGAASGDSPAAKTTPRRNPAARRRPPSPRALIETAGPTPESILGDVRLAIGTLAGPHGLDGEIKLRVVSDHPEHIPTLSTVYLGDSEEPVRMVSARQHGDLMLIRLEGITTPEEAKLLGRLPVRVAATDLRPLEPGEYFLYQLIGLEARTPAGETLGTVTDLIETGANDVLVISQPGTPDLLVPNHPQFVHEIAPERTLIVIEPPVYNN
jgi:16S rRNA processing protein RimM